MPAIGHRSWAALLPTGAGDMPDPMGGSTIEEVRFIHGAHFAFVTFTTLGFGDGVPRTALARRSTILFSLLGPFHLAVNSGVLIGRSIHQEQPGPWGDPQAQLLFGTVLRLPLRMA